MDREDGVRLRVPGPEEGAEIDVILVHGLGGDSRTTWEAKGPNKEVVNWVTDKGFLPAALPKARIITYGYNANFWKDRVTSRVEDHADGLRAGLLTFRRKCQDRPIVWTGHSLGGIIIKRALITHDEEYCTYIRKASSAIIFLGTPHHGSDNANNPWLLITRKLVACANLRHNVGPLFKELKPFSDTLRDTTKSFSEISAPFLIRSFFETKPTRLPPPEGDQLIVQEGAAVMGLPNEKGIPLSTTHEGLCKFASTTDPNYIILCQQIVDLTSVSVEKVSERLKCHMQLSERFKNLSVPNGALPPFRLDIDIDSPDRRERVSSYRTTPGGSEHVRLKYVEDIATEVFRRQTEEDLARVLELLNCLRNQQCSSTHLNYQHKQPSDDFEEVLQDLRKSPTNTSRDNAQASLISYIGIGGNLVRVIDNIKASLRSWTPACKRLVQTFRRQLSLFSQQIQLRLCVLMQFMPTMLLYTPVGQCIRFEDFYGKIRSFDMTHLQHFQVFEVFIRCEYRGGLGGQKVERNEYRIGSASNLSVVATADTWSGMACDGAHLIMSAAVETTNLKQCPTCKAQFSNEDRSSYYCECCSQNCYFQRESQPEAKIDQVSAENHSFEPSPQNLQFQAESENRDALELGLFKHLWVPYSITKKKGVMEIAEVDGVIVGSPLDDGTIDVLPDSKNVESEGTPSEAESDELQEGRQGVKLQIKLDAELDSITQEQKEDVLHWENLVAIADQGERSGEAREEGVKKMREAQLLHTYDGFGDLEKDWIPTSALKKPEKPVCRSELWGCHHCKDGPISIANHSSCVNCGHRYCSWCAFY